MASTLRCAQMEITAVMNVSLTSLWRKNDTSNGNEGHRCVCAHMARKAGDMDGVSLWKGLLRANTKVDSIRELISLIYRDTRYTGSVGKGRKMEGRTQRGEWNQHREGWRDWARQNQGGKKMAKRHILNFIQMFLKEVTNACQGWIYLMKNIVISLTLWNVVAI